MAAAFGAAHVTTPRTRIVADQSELRDLHGAGVVGFPCVVKPADGAGSAGVTVVTGPEDLEPAWHAARAAKVMYGLPRDPRVLVQDHIQGSEFSVESLTQHGVTSHLCITRKHTTSGTHRVELGHALPARLPPATERVLLDDDQAAFEQALQDRLVAHRESAGADPAARSLLPVGTVTLAALACLAHGWQPGIRSAYLPEALVSTPQQ